MSDKLKLLSSLVSRALLATRAGLQFGGDRDLYKVYGYPRVLKEKDLYDKYKRQDIASTVVDRPAEALWTDPPQVRADETFSKSWDKFVQENDIWTTILRADKLLGMEKYVILLLGLPGDSEKPAPKGAKKPSFIQVYGGSYAQITKYNTDASKPDFGYPAEYELKLSTDEGSHTVLNSIKVHSSRVIHLTNELLESRIFSQPRLVKGYNILEDIMKVAGGSAETFWLTANRGMQVDVDKDMELSAQDAADLSDEVEEFHHQLRRIIRTRGVKINTLGSDVADPHGVFATQISLLAATYKIPQRILMGAEAGQLASEQDRANWAVSIQERRDSFAEPYILKPIVSRLVEVGLLQAPSAPLEFLWPEAFKVSPLERAQTMAQTARAVVNLSRQAQYGHPIVTTDEARAVVGLPPNSELPTVQDALEFVADPNKEVGNTPENTEEPNSTDNPSPDDLTDEGSHSAKGISNPPDQSIES